MFSTGVEPVTANRSSYSPDSRELRARRLLQNHRGIEPVRLAAPRQDTPLCPLPTGSAHAR